jgi:hypothetical protein
MSVCRPRLVAALFALATLTISPLVSGHTRDALDHATTAPAPNAKLEGLSGTVRTLIIEDRVAQMTMRYVTVVPDNGKPVALVGPDVRGLTDGATIAVTGKRNGNVLFVESMQQGSA